MYRFNVGHDPANKGFYNSYMQCYSIMTEKGKFCQDCLKWSDKNIVEFKKFITYKKYTSTSINLYFLYFYICVWLMEKRLSDFRGNRNRCYLLNTPRSLHPYGVPIRSLLPSIQCLCYGFQPRDTTNVCYFIQFFNTFI